MLVMTNLMIISIVQVIFSNMSETVEMIGDADYIVPEVPTISQKKRKLRSAVWTDFERICEDGQITATCKHCKKSLLGSSKSGTSHLKKHLEHCNPYKSTKKGQTEEVKSDGSSNIQNFKFDQESSRRELARMILMHKLPFSIVECVGFRKFLKGLQPQFEMVSRDTIESDCMKIYNSEKQKLFDGSENLQCQIDLTAAANMDPEHIESIIASNHDQQHPPSSSVNFQLRLQHNIFYCELISLLFFFYSILHY